MVKASVIGATGYAGAELVRLLSSHPAVQLVGLTTQSYAGQAFWEVYPHLYGYVDIICREQDLPALLAESDVVFTALPHGHAMAVAREVLQAGRALVDLGADFRLHEVQVYQDWYRLEHTAPELLPRAVYGLPEIHREKIRSARLVANPGCYPTSAILALAPLLKRGLVDTDTIVIDSKSGVSGAGRGLSLTTHYCEVNESIKAYGVASHRHTPEMEQELSGLAGKRVVISFTPHLTPMNRGILSTIYARLLMSLGQEEILSLYREFYREAKFVRVLPAGMLPATKMVVGSNHCDIGLVVDSRTGRVVVVSAIDNLIKGAAGQAVQNMNIMFGLPEDTGLAGPGMYP
ncbi:N-acetyl-gamma-glutamyl-phosphate reductase [Desulfofundulus thermobenzoicus]|uniref:N-acetyl-gamma-glutamyl-phosphate reductase n=1 Tax=Desulfofundulus thermobenzoicus TaxID=29376 RepID=A0A6N7IMA4_9FIRM|nr:N-acetyl-gamma-glutamyl-phosphate reductase [Desulfofundulus thermobenzoicus]MQL51102.1 N-acetyl-gamma-glutamyl-phosphate reductase [Desulfofundulus thermobenzoicus]HHW42514.1 N-acetyl-gamma-glutamyl-phosphate reductase [Desulfotomaculum sp.]